MSPSIANSRNYTVGSISAGQSGSDIYIYIQRVTMEAIGNPYMFKYPVVFPVCTYTIVYREDF